MTSPPSQAQRLKLHAGLLEQNVQGAPTINTVGLSSLEVDSNADGSGTVWIPDGIFDEFETQPVKGYKDKSE